MTDHPQLTIDGREAPILAPQAADSSHEQPRLFDHAPSIRGQLAMPTDPEGSNDDHR